MTEDGKPYRSMCDELDDSINAFKKKYDDMVKAMVKSMAGGLLEPDKYENDP